MPQRAYSAEAAAHLRRWLEDDRNFFTVAARTTERADVSTAFALLTQRGCMGVAISQHRVPEPYSVCVTCD
jgi:hypothetical protein